MWSISCRLVVSTSSIGEIRASGSGPKVRSRSGCVEHVIHERIQAGLKKITTSDHHPVSMVVEFR
jgi:hypothetical protein